MSDPCPGLELRRTPEGIAFVRLHYCADEALDTATETGRQNVARLRNRFTSEALWRQEMEIDAHAQSGLLVYPEFEHKIHVVADSMIPSSLCRYMAIDPHPRTPHAMLWIGVDGYGDLWAYREIWPSVCYGTPRQVRDSDLENHFTVREYAEQLALLEGNVIEWKNAESDDEYGVYRKRKGGERIIIRFMDQASKAFIASDEAESEESMSRRYNRCGIDCADPYKSHAAGEDSVHDALLPRWHQLYGSWPKLHIGQSLSELIFEFEHYRYKVTKRQTEERELKQEGIEARRHLLDSLRYLLTSDQLYYNSILAS